MTIEIKHSTQVDTGTWPDDGVSPVGSDEWNESHSLVQASNALLGRVTAGNGPTQELTPSQVSAFLGLGNAATKNTGTGSGDVAAGDHSHSDATTGASGFMSSSDKTKLNGIEASADVTDAANVGSTIHGAAAKATPVDADTVALIDSAASNALKKLSWSNIKATLKAYFDTLYAAVSHNHPWSAITDKPTTLSGFGITDAVPSSHVGAGGAAHANATTSVDGFMSASDKTKLNGIATGAQVNTVTSVAGKTGAVTLAKGDVGLGNVDNTSDANKQTSFLAAIRDGVDGSMDTLAKMVSVFTSALNGKANTSHTHSASDLTNVGAETTSTSDPSGGANGDKWFKV